MGLWKKAATAANAAEAHIDAAIGITWKQVEADMAARPASAAKPKASAPPTFNSNLAELTASSAHFKALAVASQSQVDALNSSIGSYETARDAALAIVTRATATAAAIDAILAPLRGLPDTPPVQQPAQTAQVSAPPATPTAA